jgi:hypothetical protein
MTASVEPLFLVGKPSRAFTSPRSRALTTARAAEEAFAQWRCGVWVAARAASLALLVHALEPRQTWHRLLVLDEPSLARRELLSTLFRVVIAPGRGVRILGAKEIAEVLVDRHPENLFVGGAVDSDDKALVLYRGSLERLVVPFSWFRARPHGARPDFSDFEVVDHGQTVRLGNYEASADTILYEFDRDTRTRLKQAEVQSDKTFGGALRRLRLQRGIPRDGFSGIAAKTIARIERGEVGRPHVKTLVEIAKRLDVEPEEIQTF